MKRLVFDALIVGVALFSMFFGAGNIIFPPYVGLASGTQWLFGFTCYYLADVGLALAAIFAMLHSAGIDRAEGGFVRLGAAWIGPKKEKLSDAH
ncbi:MAG: branched-chain amino acid transport system II carrier protein [Desulfovibrio sp.]|nr:branched-chain amino acid transport system II carrier protein [Desulfovibrio sp.]